jgi:hypothetical protein
MIKNRLKRYILEVVNSHFGKVLYTRVIVADCMNSTWPTKPNATFMGDAGGSSIARVLLDGEEKTSTYNYDWIRFPKGKK